MEAPQGSTSGNGSLARGMTKARRYAKRATRQTARTVKDRAAESQDPTLAWLRRAGRKHPVGSDVWSRLEENRRRLIADLAPGHSFLDLGGMYRIAGDMAFQAEQSGASRVVLFDGMDPSDAFVEKHRQKSSKVEFVQGDLHDPGAIADLGHFDVVWCTGVIYHSPNPIQQILHLRRLATQTLVLGTNVIPEIPGIEQTCVLYPGLSEQGRSSYSQFHGGPGQFPGMTSEFDETPLMSYANMWWGFSPSALRSMLRFSGFDVKEEYLYTPFWLDVVANVGGVSTDIYPPLNQSAGRVLARHADLPTSKLPQWAAGQVSALRERESQGL